MLSITKNRDRPRNRQVCLTTPIVAPAQVRFDRSHQIGLPIRSKGHAGRDRGRGIARHKHAVGRVDVIKNSAAGCVA